MTVVLLVVVVVTEAVIVIVGLLIVVGLATVGIFGHFLWSGWTKFVLFVLIQEETTATGWKISTFYTAKQRQTNWPPSVLLLGPSNLI